MPINEILLVPHTHHDMGYTHAPETCMRMQERVIHDVLDLCERGDDDAPDAFRWTIEISRPLIAFLRHGAPADIDRLRTLVARSRIAVTAAYLHMTQLIGHEEHVRFFQPVREIRAHDLSVSVVQHGDINGLAWGSVSLMADAGLETLVLALNPDHGRPPFEQPSAFIWEGQDGARVLVWLSLHYSTANNPWQLTAGRIDKAIEPIGALIERLEARDDYPFDFVIIHSAEDNMLPNDHLCDAVRLWNAAGLQPPMRIVTLETAVERLRPFRDRLPVYRGEWADWWANGHGSSAYEVGVSRLLRSELRAAELTRALAQIEGERAARSLLHGDLPLTNWYRAGTVPPLREDWAQRMESTYDNLLLFEEHTWGTFESIDKPFSLFTQTHWNLKAGFAYRAAAEAHDLAREGLVKLALTLPEVSESNVIAVNPLSYARDELVEVRTPGIDHVMLIRDIPPLGARVVAWDAQVVDRREVLDAPSDGWFENDDYRLQVDPASGSIIHLMDRATGREWVDSDALTGIGGVIYEQPEPDSDHPAVTQHRRHFHPDTPGPRFVYTPAHGDKPLTIQRAPFGVIITTETSAPFLPRILTEITLFDDLKQIDISVRIDKIENYGMEGVYVAFPFALRHQPTFWLESANAVYRAGIDQLPDTCCDWYSIQHGVGVTDGENSVLWATREAPLVQLGSIHTGEWARRLHVERGHVYAWLMNNLYFTNFKAAQGGQTRFNFRLTTRRGAVEESDVRRFGDSFAVLPLARLAPVEIGAYQWLEITPESVQTQTLTLDHSNTDALILRLKETSGQQKTAHIGWHGQQTITVERTNLLESAAGEPLVGDGHAFDLTVKPHELVTLRLIPTGTGYSSGSPA